MPKRKIRLSNYTPRSISRLDLKERKEKAQATFKQFQWAPLGNDCYLNTGKMQHVYELVGHVCKYDGNGRSMVLEDEGTLGCAFCSTTIGKRKTTFVILTSKTSGSFNLDTMTNYLERQREAAKINET